MEPISPKEKAHKTRVYTGGFIACVLLTLVAFGLVHYDLASGGELLAALAILAIAQVCIQLLFFLHIGEEAKPRWKLVTFWSMLGTIIIIVWGSLWIMQNLNYNMSGHDMMEYMQEQNKKGF